MDEDLKRIAARLRGWRDEAGLTLQKLGDRSGVSASTIHKIENLQTVPTISVLLKVANGLNRRPSELLEDIETEKQVAILRREDRRRLSINGNAELEHLIGMIPRSRLDAWRIHLQAGMGPGRPGSDAWNFYGELVIIVEDGCVEVEMGGESYVIETGDSIHFDSSMTHSWVAGRSQPAKVTVIAIIPEHLHTEIKSRAAAVAVSGIESFEIQEVEASDEAIVADREAP